MLFFKEKINYDIILLKNICKKLPDKYNYIKKQVNEGIIFGLKRDKRNNFRQLKFDINLLNKYENKKGPEFLIENIVLKQRKTNENITASISIAYGLLMGYDININDVSEIDLENIDMDNINEKYTFDESIKKLFSKDELKYVNLGEIYEVELDGKIYYHILDLEDSDFIGMDKKKQLYEITHDPYEIKLIKKTIVEYLKK